MPPTPAACPTAVCGVWEQRMTQCESLCPLLEGLGMPRALAWAGCPVVDKMKTTLRISCPNEHELEVVDKTPFGRNATRADLDGSEREKTTRGGRKKFFLSASTTEDHATLDCRLCAARPNTRLTRTNTPRDRSARAHAPLYPALSHPLYLDPSSSVSRGDGWHTLQHRYLSSETDARGDRLLIEKNVLVRPGQPDVTVERVFERRGDELRGNAQPPAEAP